MSIVIHEGRRWFQWMLEKLSYVILSVVYRGRGDQLPPIKDPILLLSATQLAFKIRTGELTSVEVVKAFISRIKEINPILNCVVQERFHDALMEACKVDFVLKSKTLDINEIGKQTPFLGVPFTTKDCLKISGLKHTAGLYSRKDVVALDDSIPIKLMRDAGAIPLALTNVPESCAWWDTNNTVYGRTKNPYNTNHIVGGSSGGEGCLLASCGSPMGIGTDLGGSIRMPCFFNGIFGHKPSKFIVSNDGQYPWFAEEIQGYLGVGPMCRTTDDLVPIMKIIAAENVKKLKLDDEVNMNEVKFYYMEDDGGSAKLSRVHPDIKRRMREVISYLENTHGVTATKVDFKELQSAVDIWLAMTNTLNGPNYSMHLANHGKPVSVAMELIKMMVGRSKHTFPGIMTILTEKTGVKFGSRKHIKLTEMGKKLSNELQEMLGDDGVFLYPTHPSPAPYHNEPIVKPYNFAYTAIFNVLEVPVTHCPLGLSSEGLPIGIQLIASVNQDHLTFAVARELEKKFGGWVAPSPVEIPSN